ncbi:MAG: sigma-54-dependent Fis family transcriptional regulator [Myxococcales bacterium]|nr:sigma-54-dependent Fis family transcriptional regulator [Myxococcales bacterium]
MIPNTPSTLPPENPANGNACGRHCLRVITRDDLLVQRLAQVASCGRCELLLGNAPESFDELWRSAGRAVLVVDGAALGLAPAWLRESCAALGPGSDGIVLMSRSASLGSGRPIQVTLYPRFQLGNLLENLSLLLPACPRDADATARIVGEAPEIRLIRQQIRDVARFRDVSVLVLGETGSGKELVAEAVHELSCGPDKPFVAVNCAAIPKDLFESELFGHEAGAYTGARGVRIGLLESAAGGTLFLDEIGQMPVLLQSKLLRALESRCFRRVGSNRDLPLTGRVVSATQRVVLDNHGGGLRPDLYYRVAGFTLTLPPLRDRPADIDLLARAFLERFRTRHTLVSASGFTERALQALHAHGWPGNVRELKLVVEHAAIISRGELVSAGDIGAVLRGKPAKALTTRPPEAPHRPVSGLRPIPPGPSDSVRLKDVEREMIKSAFEGAAGNVSRAAELLGIPRTTLRARLKRYGLV